MIEQPLSQVLILLAGSLFVVMLARRLGLPAILGYLFVGMALGPHAFGLVSDSTTTQLLAELGVIFLLFTLGLEFSLPRMLAMKREVFGLGAAQVIATTAVFAVHRARVRACDWLMAVVLGGAISMSSTAIIMHQLTERAELNRTHGRLAFSMLLFQDLAFVPFLALAAALRAGRRAVLPGWRTVICRARRRDRGRRRAGRGALAAAAAVPRDRAQPPARAVHAGGAVRGARFRVDVAHARACRWRSAASSRA